MKDKKWPLPVFIVLLLFLLPSITGHNYYVLHVANICCIFTILAMGLNMLQGYTGLVSIGQAGFYAIGAYISGLLAVKLGLPFLICLFIGALVASIVGLALGLTTVRLYGGYLALVTVGFGRIIQLIAINWVEMTGGGEGLLGIPPAKLGTVVLTPEQFYYFALLVTVILFVITVNLVNSKIGRALIAIREQRIAANMMGIDVAGYRLIAFVIAACYSGIAGGLYAFFAGSLFPDYFSLPQSIIILIMVILGGAGTLYGPIIGAVLVTIGFEFLRPLQSYQMIIYGFGVVLVVMFMPYGIVGVARHLLQIMQGDRKGSETGVARG
ncbi:MAG: branched-chain amino acid transport system ATP-binding protein livM [Clostridia bacterium]|nr:branched-chain amino acid transport system ATP-binding protein livM [Clostridia bacterium]